MTQLRSLRTFLCDTAHNVSCNVTHRRCTLRRSEAGNKSSRKHMKKQKTTRPRTGSRRTHMMSLNLTRKKSSAKHPGKSAIPLTPRPVYLNHGGVHPSGANHRKNNRCDVLYFIKGIVKQFVKITIFSKFGYCIHFGD